MVGLNGYVETAGNIANISGGTSIALIVLVDPEEATEFERHAKQHYINQGYPTTAGETDDGFGIRRKDENASSGYSIDHEGNHTEYGSNNTILTPVLDHSTWGSTMLMYNVHVSSTAVDSIINCSNQLQIRHDERKIQEGKFSPPQCSIITGFKMNSENELVGLIYTPIYPRHDPTTLVGIIGLSVTFNDVLNDLVPEYLLGIEAVISTHTVTSDYTSISYDTVTYHVEKGVPHLEGEGDLHDKSFDDFGRSIVLNGGYSEATDTVIYTLTLYPSNFTQYSTRSPLAVSLGLVAVILASTMIFFVYDFLMRRESSQQKDVLDLKRRFVRFISHEIRTPLNTVSMGLDLLEKDIRSHIAKAKVEEPEQTHVQPTTTDLGFWYQITQDIKDNTLTAVSILNDLLNYDKIESGTLQLEVGTVDIIALATETVRKFNVQAVNKKIDYRFKILSCKCGLFHDFANTSADPKGHTPKLEDSLVVGDEMRINQVICNLISNALKFTPAGGRVEVTMEHLSPPDCSPCRCSKDPALGGNLVGCDCPRRGSVVIKVSDNGVGMTEEQVILLFAEGIQFDANKLQAGGGSGLGLCISKGIIEQHNGYIKAYSDGLGQGSVFSIELPLYDFLSDKSSYQTAETSEDPGQIVPSVHISQPDEVTGPLNDDGDQSRHILIVEDVASSRKMLIRLLEHMGHTCEAACNGQEAVDKFLATQNNSSETDLEPGMKPFDTILMDFEMPVMNGPTATEKVRILFVIILYYYGGSCTHKDKFSPAT
jgi:signal transduction histidine kinase